jgi:hypothetical protein
MRVDGSAVTVTLGSWGKQGRDEGERGGDARGKRGEVLGFPEQLYERGGGSRCGAAWVAMEDHGALMPFSCSLLGKPGSREKEAKGYWLEVDWVVAALG